MGIYSTPESSLGKVPGSNFIAGASRWRGTSTGRHLDALADREAINGDWPQPRLSSDAQQRILALYDEFRPRLYRYLGSMGLRRDWSEEVIQETFMRLTVELLKKDDIENVQGWVVRVAHNLAMDVFKKEHGESSADETAALLIENRADRSTSTEEGYARNEQAIKMNIAMATREP